jgi:hypothetical protein
MRKYFSSFEKIAVSFEKPSLRTKFHVPHTTRDTLNTNARKGARVEKPHHVHHTLSRKEFIYYHRSSRSTHKERTFGVFFFLGGKI